MDIQNIPSEHHHNTQYSEPTSLHYSHHHQSSRPSPSLSLSSSDKHTLPTIPEYSSPPITTTTTPHTMMEGQDLLLPNNINNSNNNSISMATTDDVLSSNIHPALMLGRYDKRKSSPAILGLPFDIANDIATSSTSSTSTSSQLDLHLSRHRNSIEAAMLLANFNRVPTVTKEVQEPAPTTTTTTNTNTTNTTTKGTNSWQDDLNIASQTQTKPSAASLRRHSYDVNMNWKSMPQEFRERADLIENAFASTFSSSSTSAFKPVIKQESLYDTNQIPNRITWTQDGLYQTDTTMNNTHPSSTSNNNNYNIYNLGSNNNTSNNNNNNNSNNNSNNSQQQHDYLHPLASSSSSSSSNNTNDLSGQKREFTYYPQQPSYYYHHQPPSSSTNSSTASSPHHLPLAQHMHPSYAPPSPLPLSSSSSSSTSLGKLPLPSSTTTSSSTTMPLPPPHPYSHNNMYMQGPPHPHPHSHHPHHPPPPHSHHPLHHPHHPLSQLPPHNDYYGHPNNPNLMMSQHQPPPPPQKPKRKRVPKETEEVVEAGDADFPDMCPRDVELAKTDPDARPRRQKLRFDGDMYTPKWVRFNGQAKEGLCDTCQPGRWLQLKNSAYWYHKQFYHGISSVSGAEFVQPIETRWVDQDLVEGLCHQCHQWVAVSNVKRKNSVLWFRHAHKCHVYHKPKNAPLRR